MSGSGFCRDATNLSTFIIGHIGYIRRRYTHSWRTRAAIFAGAKTLSPSGAVYAGDSVACGTASCSHCCCVWEISCKVLFLSFRGPLTVGCLTYVHATPAAVHPSQGATSLHLIFLILQPSHARLMTLRPDMPAYFDQQVCRMSDFTLPGDRPHASQARHRGGTLNPFHESAYQWQPRRSREQLSGCVLLAIDICRAYEYTYRAK